MEFYEVIDKRKTVREWQDKEVSVETVKHIIDAGLKAPTHHHLREWEFIVLHDTAEKEIALQYAKEWTEKHGLTDPDKLFPDGTVMQRMYKYAMPRQYLMLSTAPVIIIPLFKAHKLNSENVSELNVFASMWCVIENMFLAATAESLGYAMRIPVGNEGADICKVLNVPDGYMMPCYIGIGYPALDVPEIEQHTYTAEQKIHFNRW